MASLHGPAQLQDAEHDAQQEIQLKFSYSTESPFDTSLRRGDGDGDTKIHTAKQIADFVLSVSLSQDEEEKARQVAKTSGICDDWPPHCRVEDPDEIYSFGCILAVAHFYNKRRDLAENKVLFSNTYNRCVCAVNSLTYFLQTPRDRTTMLPGPVRLDVGERWKLDRAWDVCVCLLGTAKVWYAFQRKQLIREAAAIVHNVHYRRAADKARDKNNLYGQGRICRKTLKLLTREEIEPFIQPYHFFKKLDPVREHRASHVNHRDCTDDACRIDGDAGGTRGGVVAPPPVEYHVPDCQGCAKIEPPPESFQHFNEIAENGMPAINVDSEARDDDAAAAAHSWWVLADNDTLVVSHVWRDGIWGTRNTGINGCVHDLLTGIAIRHGCKSYWLDCAVIPEDDRTRKQLIMRINSTFWQAKIVLCWDNWLSHVVADPQTLLLSIMVSPWHRRAWTLLEANRARPRHIRFLRWKRDETTGQWSPCFFDLHKAVENVLGDSSSVPLWIRSALVDLLPYSGINLSADAAGLLLSGRHASRPGDAESIWGLIRPFETRINADDLPFHDPYAYTKGEVDVAFISSDAARFAPRSGATSWRPGSTTASVWARTAYGGIKARIINGGRDTKNLKSSWWVKRGHHLRAHIKKDPGSEELLDLDLRAFDGFALICPILQGDVGGAALLPPDERARGSVKGFFRTSISMECSRAIAVTLPKSDDVWQWRGLVHLAEPIFFGVDDEKEFVIGG